MDGYARSSSSPLRRRRRVAASLALACAGAGCVEELPPLDDGTSSLRVELVSPDPGSPDDRLAPDQRDLVVRVRALRPSGELNIGFVGTVDLYTHYLGSLTPSLEAEPLESVEVVRGESKEVALTLPPVFGPTFLWAEHVTGQSPTYATGTSPSLWYREPFLADVSRPEDEMGLDALEASPLELKQVKIAGSRYGDRGRLVVTGVFAQGYTVADVECADADGTPPCTTGDYDSVFVFTFSRPEDEDGVSIERGDVIASINGSISEFNGLTEVNFPQTFLASAPRDAERVPPPVTMQESWISSRIEFERAEAGLIAVEGGVVCPIDDDYETFGQWKLDVGRGCGDPINVVTKGEVGGFDPNDHVGQELPRVVGALRPINIGSFHVWIIYPRDDADLTLPDS